MVSEPASVDLSPFRLDMAGDQSWRGGLLRWMTPTLEHVLRFPTLNRIYRQAHAAAVGGDTRPFVERCLDILDVHINVCDADLARLPATGPLIVVANHPFGGLDGMILTALLRRVRPDAKVLANHLLRRIPEMRESCLFVDPFGGEGATRRNIAAMAAAVRWVRRGGALGIFPSGEVAHLDMRRRCVTDGAVHAGGGPICRASLGFHRELRCFSVVMAQQSTEQSLTLDAPRRSAARFRGRLLGGTLPSD